MSISAQSRAKAKGKPRRQNRVQRRITAKKEAARERAIRQATPPATVMLVGLALQGLSVAYHLPQLPHMPYAEMAAGGLIGGYGLRAIDAARSRHDGGKAAIRRRRKYQGHATTGDIRQHMSLHAARRRAKVTRPSLGGSTRGLPPGEAGVILGKAGHPARLLLASHEDVVVAVGPARSGKTSAVLAPAILDAPGACLASSTRVDLYEHTALLRGRQGPVLQLNPGGDGGIPTTLGWSLLDGCHIPQIAIERAGYLQHAAPSDKGGKDAHWDGRGANLNRIILHAAAVAGATAADAAAWVRDPRSREIASVLRDRSPVPEWAGELEALTSRDSDYVDGVIHGAAAALDWMSDPAMAAIASPGGDGFDAVQFLAEGGTVYMIGTDRPHNALTIYYACLTAHLFDTAKRMASMRPGGRLDPPLTLALDEPAITCPVPLDKWVSEAGGHGISIVTGFQSRSQMSDRWGENGAATIWNNAGVKVIFGGTAHEADLKALSEVCGTRDTWHHVTGPDGTRTRQPDKEPLFPPERIRLISRGKALILHRYARPVVARTLPVWERPGYEKAPLGPAGFREPQHLAIEAPHPEPVLTASPLAPAVTGPASAEVMPEIPDTIPDGPAVVPSARQH